MTIATTYKKHILLAAAGGLVIVVGGLGIWWFLAGNIAARVNGSVIYKSDYEKNLEAQKTYNDRQKINLADNELKENVLDGLIREKVIEQEAKKAGISVSAADINEKYSRLAEANGGEEAFSQKYSDYFGFTKEEYIKYKITPSLYEQKLEEKVTGEESYSKSAEEKINQAKKELDNGAKFSDVVKKYSEDEASRKQEGDMGWITRASTVKEFEEVAFSLKKGQISSVFKTIYGYHIIKVTDKKGKKVKVSQILIKIRPFSQWLKEKVSQAKVVKYVKI